MNTSLEDRLGAALDDEYKARATYRAVISKFGPVRPFVNIVASEQRHVSALLALYAAYDLPVPEDPWPSRIVVPATVAAACAAAVEGERENLAMYDRLLAETPEMDVHRVLTRLQTASRDRHLPAFERCAGRRGPLQDARRGRCRAPRGRGFSGPARF